MFRSKSIIAMTGLLAMLACQASADVLFQDGFDLEPGTSGTTGRTGSQTAWTETNPGGGYPDGFTQGTVADVDGVQHEVAIKVGDTATDPVFMERTISTSGYGTVQVSLAAFDIAEHAYERTRDGYRWGEYVSIEYSTDGGTNWNMLLFDNTAWDAMHDPGDAEGSPDTVDGDGKWQSTGMLTVNDPAAGNNANFALRIGAKGNNGDDFYIDGVIVEGVPEPMTTSLLVLGGLVALRRRRRA